MSTKELDSLGWCQLLQLWTQESSDPREYQDGDYEARDPEQSDGALVAELVIHGGEEVDEIEHDQDGYNDVSDAWFVTRVELRQGRSAAGQQVGQATVVDANFFVLVIFVVVVIMCLFGLILHAVNKAP